MAIFLTQDFLPPRLAQVFRTIVELLAAIPSVVYGLWGLFVVVPAHAARWRTGSTSTSAGSRSSGPR